MPSLQLSQVSCRGDACRRPRLSSPTLVVAHAIAPAGRRRRPCRFPDGLVRVGTGRRKGVGRHLARRKRSRAGFGMGDRAPCGRDRVAGWATTRVAPTRASSPSCSGVGRRLSSPMPVSRWPRSGRYGTPQGRGTPPRTKETKPCWIRDGRPQGSPLRGPRRRVVRGVGATLVVAHAGFPMASFGSVRDAARAWDATSYEGNEAVLDSGWATARPAGAIGSRDGRPRGSPLRGPRRRAVRGRRGDACRRPCRFPDGLVRVGTGRHKGVPYGLWPSPSRSETRSAGGRNVVASLGAGSR